MSPRSRWPVALGAGPATRAVDHGSKGHRRWPLCKSWGLSPRPRCSLTQQPHGSHRLRPPPGCAAMWGPPRHILAHACLCCAQTWGFVGAAGGPRAGGPCCPQGREGLGLGTRRGHRSRVGGSLPPSQPSCPQRPSAGGGPRLGSVPWVPPKAEGREPAGSRPPRGGGCPLPLRPCPPCPHLRPPPILLIAPK